MKVRMNPVITERYAKALLAVARREGVAGELREQAMAVMPFFASGSKLRRFLDGPQIATEDKQQMLHKAFGGKVHRLLANLFDLLLSKGRIEFAESILQRLKVLVEEDQGLFEAEVATATPLDAAQKQTLQTILERFSGARLLISFVVDPYLIGGVRFIYGDVLIDDTVRGKLHRLRQQLQEAARE